MYCSNCHKQYENSDICPNCRQKNISSIGNSDDSYIIYKNFRESIKNWPKTKQEKTNKFINKNLNNQLQRLNSYGLVIETMNQFDNDVYSLKDSSAKDIVNIFLKVLNNSNQTFSNQSYFITGTKISKYYKNNKLIKKINFPNRLYVIVTSVNDQEKILTKNYRCPNCGNIIELAKLISGCKYCGSKFMISDLYPIVTNYYHSSMEQEKIPFKKVYFISLLVLIFPMLKLTSQLVLDEKILNLNEQYLYPIVHVVSSILVTIFMPLLFSGVYIFIRQFILAGIYYSGKAIKRQKYTELENYMHQFDPNFTYYLFEGKIISMLKEVIFSSNPKDLTINETENNTNYSKIIDSDFLEMYINNMYVKNDLVYIDLKMQMYNTLYDNNKIKRKKQNFYITVARKKDVYTTSNLRIESINCKFCGAIIDIEKYNSCKYCNNKYDLKEYDFVFKKIEIN